ncbi:MAG: VOC family protein [Planctomycetota bacterium]
MQRRLSHALIFTVDLAAMIRFYTDAFGLAAQGTADAGFVLMRANSGADVALHQVPPHVAQEIAMESPAKWRDESALKLCFEVDDLGAQRQLILGHGGQAQEPWSWEGADYCECADPEGNVVQIYTRKA